MSIPFYASVNLSGTSVGGTITVSGAINLPAYEVGTTSVTASMDWVDNGDAAGARPETVEVTLYQNGEAYETKTVSATAATVSFAGLPAAYGGKNYSYTVGGSEVADYIVSAPASKAVTYTYALVPELGFRMGFAI